MTEHDKRSARARQLRAAGKRVIGYFCCYTPVEVLTAADVVPFRIAGRPGDNAPEADSCMEQSGCPFVRNCTGLMLRGEMDFLDGIVVPHSCDAIQRTYGFWKKYLGAAYSHYIEVPHTISASSVKFLQVELERLRQSLAGFVGREITDFSLRSAIQAHNRNRGLVKSLYELRRNDPPPISAVKVLDTLLNGLAMPVAEFNDLLARVIGEAKEQADPTLRVAPRLMVQGCVVDAPALMALIEGCGANVVMDDFAIGTRTFWFKVDEHVEPLAALAHAYLHGIRCPRTIVGEKDDRASALENRFGYLVQYARESRAQGVVAYLLPFCDCHSFDMPDMIEYLEGHGIPRLALDHGYTSEGDGQLRNRVEAFVEMIGAED